MVGPWPLAPHHDHLQYIHHIHLMQQGQNQGITFIGSKDTINITGFYLTLISEDTFNITRFYLTLSIDVPLFINVWLALLIVELFIKISCTFIGSQDTINITRFYLTFNIDVPLFINV